MIFITFQTSYLQLSTIMKGLNNFKEVNDPHICNNVFIVNNMSRLYVIG